MKRLILTVALGVFALALPVFAADAPAKSTTKPSATASRMDPAKGAFHRKHVQKLKLGCESCHDAKSVDVLVVHRLEAGGSAAPVNREACRSCHQAPAKPGWYGAAK